jgi:REP element-mobilizing transposase RayT
MYSGAKPDFRVVHYSFQKDHIHLIVEADDRRALARGMKGLGVRVARAVNVLMNRWGTWFRIGITRTF